MQITSQDPTEEVELRSPSEASPEASPVASEVSPVLDLLDEPGVETSKSSSASLLAAAQSGDLRVVEGLAVAEPWWLASAREKGHLLVVDRLLGAGCDPKVRVS